MTITLTEHKDIAAIPELVSAIDSEHKMITVKNVEFKAAADKNFYVRDTELKNAQNQSMGFNDLYDNYSIKFEHCIFEFVSLNFGVCRNADIEVNKCIFSKFNSYTLNFTQDGYGKVSITNCTFSTGRGILLRTPSQGKDALVDGCSFELLSNEATGKARAIQIASYDYYYAKQTDQASLDYYHSMSGTYSGSRGCTLSGKISITNNTFAKASYGVYVYEAQSGGGFTYGNVSADTKMFDKLNGNTFGAECTFKYGTSDMGDGRSYTNKGYNTGLISSQYRANATVQGKRALIGGYDAEDYWDQMRALKELEGSL